MATLGPARPAYSVAVTNGSHLRLVSAALLAATLAAPATAAPQSNDPDASHAGEVPAAASFDGPAPPVPPAVVARDKLGRVTLRAVRLERPLVIDGRLDDEVYLATQPIEDFV